MATTSFQSIRKSFPPPSFDPKLVNVLLEPDNRENRSRFRQHMVKNAALFAPRFNIPLEKERELAFQRLRGIGQARLLSVLDFETNPLNIFAGISSDWDD